TRRAVTGPGLLRCRDLRAKEFSPGTIALYMVVRDQPLDSGGGGGSRADASVLSTIHGQAAQPGYDQGLSGELDDVPDRKTRRRRPSRLKPGLGPVESRAGL